MLSATVAHLDAPAGPTLVVSPTGLEGCLLLRSTPAVDDRGGFARHLDAAALAAAGIDLGPDAQQSASRSRQGVVRGLHGRRAPGEAKVVRCTRGAVWDVVVDLRPGSPTCGRWEARLLAEAADEAVVVPPGCFHGFQALTTTADVAYVIDRGHDPADDLAVAADDPDLGITWPLVDVVRSLRDRSAPPAATVLAALRRAGS